MTSRPCARESRRRPEGAPRSKAACYRPGGPVARREMGAPSPRAVLQPTRVMGEGVQSGAGVPQARAARSSPRDELASRA